jgi:hypothetical protein
MMPRDRAMSMHACRDPLSDGAYAFAVVEITGAIHEAAPDLQR